MLIDNIRRTGTIQLISLSNGSDDHADTAAGTDAARPMTPSPPSPQQRGAHSTRRTSLGHGRKEEQALGLQDGSQPRRSEQDGVSRLKRGVVETRLRMLLGNDAIQGQDFRNAVDGVLQGARDVGINLVASRNPEKSAMILDAVLSKTDMETLSVTLRIDDEKSQSDLAAAMPVIQANNPHLRSFILQAPGN